MVKKIVKGILLFIGIIVMLATGFYLKVYFSTESRIHKTYEITPQHLEVNSDSALLSLGERLVIAKGCTDCHGEDLGGRVFLDDPALGLIVARNLTKGNGGLPENHTIEDWVLALEHGVRRNGKPLLIMPSHEYTHLSEHDTKAIIAYGLQLPKVDRVLPKSKVRILGRILTDLDKLPLLPAEMIDHTKERTTEVKAEVSVEFGKYLAVACQGCHRENMKGGDPIAPGFPVVADISSSGNPGRWTDEQFIQTLRSGKTPEGKELNPAEMPWTMTQAYTDTELKALHLYLQSI